MDRMALEGGYKSECYSRSRTERHRCPTGHTKRWLWEDTEVEEQDRYFDKSNGQDV